MAKEFIADFNLENNQGEIVEFTLQENNVNATFEIKSGTSDHERLFNRDKDNQHPISAITGLTEALEELSKNSDKFEEVDIDTEEVRELGQTEPNYEFEQAITENTWIIHHNLNKKPSVTVVDEYDRVIVPEIRYISNNEIELTFNFAFKGKAYLN